MVQIWLVIKVNVKVEQLSPGQIPPRQVLWDHGQLSLLQKYVVEYDSRKLLFRFGQNQRK